jgi:putative SOS response-associated peptidase YedK
VIEPVRHRMAAILPRDAEARWLNPSASVDDLLGLMIPLNPARMVAHRVRVRAAVCFVYSERAVVRTGLVRAGYRTAA